MRKITECQQKSDELMISAETDIHSQSFQHSGSAKFNESEKMAPVLQEVKCSKPHQISNLVLIGIMLVPVILIAIVIYVMSNIFFP